MERPDRVAYLVFTAAMFPRQPEYPMTRTWLATALNFFFPGLGYLVIGHKPLLAVAWLAGVLGLTYVETSIQTAAPAYYVPMFVSVLVMNLAFAADAWQIGRNQVRAATHHVPG